MTKKELASFHLERYFVQLFGIKNRLLIVDKFIKLEKTTGVVGVDVEFVCLQLRKTLEQIAMLSLIANINEYSKVQRKFASQWNAKKIIKELELLNEDFYPIPAKIDEDERGKFINPVQTSCALTKDEFLDLYQLCSSVIHAENPYIDDPKLARKIESSFKKWYDKIYNLISSHVIVLYKLDYTFYGELFNETQIPRVQILEKISN